MTLEPVELTQWDMIAQAMRLDPPVASFANHLQHPASLRFFGNYRKCQVCGHPWNDAHPRDDPYSLSSGYLLGVRKKCERKLRSRKGREVSISRDSTIDRTRMQTFRLVVPTEHSCRHFPKSILCRCAAEIVCRYRSIRTFRLIIILWHTNDMRASPHKRVQRVFDVSHLIIPAP
jgi:hypothetical protein